MFDKILIANRGEIAARIIRTCQQMGIATVAVYSEADEGAPHVEMADEAHLIGPAHVTKSYLNIERIVEVAQESGADAVHPGYGLLSENAAFVAALEDAQITFIGPTSAAIEMMGDKANARRIAQNATIPIVPGTDGPITDEHEAIVFAEGAGYPVLVKASAGGGGIGMKKAKNEKKLRKAIQSCQRRGESAFGDGAVYVEKYIERPHHIEVQILADHQGNVVHLFERECSVQRRHQKVIEEAPSPLVERTTRLRQSVCRAAVKLARQVGYTNAGTVEFIADEMGNFYFIEMNTRLQVEHPVTEAITGVDIVAWQIRIAAGEELELTQDELEIDGHALECRVYAEDPDKKFMPAPGQITEYVEPSGEGVRVDSGVRGEWDVTPYYDPLVAKLITHGATRGEAIERMKGALDGYTIGGLTTNLAMHREVLEEEDFVAGVVHTHWLESR